MFVSSTVVEEGRIAFGEGVSLPYRITNEGGALGQIRYEVFAERDGKRSKIFEGISGERFRVSKSGPGLIRIRFCNGLIEHVSSIAAAGDRPTIVVQPDLTCLTGV